ncbi:MAG: (2Fe-2S)-binding protein [Chloroflexota bacterium]
MTATRLTNKPNTTKIQLTIDGQPTQAYLGESIAAVLMLMGKRTFTQPSAYNLPRTLFCGMGVCHQCLVTVDGVADVRACVTPVQEGMGISTQFGIDKTGAQEVGGEDA